ncbi:hypothetical protein GCM10010206_05710 [Streptomyces cinerochromogenes]|nr:hypothetical protein GCM10010206_05710 [Streptomyces cinerochromogenes]
MSPAADDDGDSDDGDDSDSGDDGDSDDDSDGDVQGSLLWLVSMPASTTQPVAVHGVQRASPSTATAQVRRKGWHFMADRA